MKQTFVKILNIGIPLVFTCFCAWLTVTTINDSSNSSGPQVGPDDRFIGTIKISEELYQSTFVSPENDTFSIHTIKPFYVVVPLKD